MLDIENIVIELGYSMLMGFWIKVAGYGKPFIIACDKDLLWFHNRILENRVVDLYLQPMHVLQVVTCKELIPSQERETEDQWYQAGDGTAGVGDGPDEDRNGTMEIDYEQKEEDIAVETCVDLTRELDSLQILDIPREECGSGSKIDCGFDYLRSLDESDCEEGEGDEGRKPKKFIKTKYHEFDLGCDIENPIFKIVMEFVTDDIFREVIKAHVVKYKRSVEFKKNDKNRIKTVCNEQGCKWFVFGLWLADHKTFKIKSLLD
ncbi:hypothetical protein LWI29_008090 [Acer saccharum]|uniref:Transposase MuDR plant domain-containing protein n=1 Tax=Acer saccharum TaxID=4024 RepID=A0AA39TAD0_ACESA|nr:hypothetical protein LWI29_008090 [Acer saccharum]